MNKKLTFAGGEPNVNFDDIFRDSEALYEFVQGIFYDIKEDLILSGATCSAPGAGNDLVVSEDGFVWLDGEVLKVDAGTYSCLNPAWTLWQYEKSTSYESEGDKTFLNGTARQTWQKNRAVPKSVSALTAMDCVDGARLTNGTIVHKKIVNIGVWDMDTDASVNVNHGLPDHTKIRSVNAVIISDAGAYYPIYAVDFSTGAVNGGPNAITSTYVTLVRTTGGGFDGTGYNDDTMNRGFVIIEYID